MGQVGGSIARIARISITYECDCCGDTWEGEFFSLHYVEDSPECDNCGEGGECDDCHPECDSCGEHDCDGDCEDEDEDGSPCAPPTILARPETDEDFLRQFEREHLSV